MLRALGVVAVVVSLALPLWWMVVASLSPEARLFAGPALFPTDVTFEHYRALLSGRRFWQPIKSSLIVAGRRRCCRWPWGRERRTRSPGSRFAASGRSSRGPWR